MEFIFWHAGGEASASIERIEGKVPFGREVVVVVLVLQCRGGSA